MQAVVEARSSTAAPTPSPVPPFNCTAYYKRVQVLQNDSDTYGVPMLVFDTCEYEDHWDIDWFDGHVNPVGLYAPEGEGAYAWGAFDGCLCKFDHVRTQCFDTPLAEEKPNVDAILDDDFYYSKDVGRIERGSYVEGTLDAEPVFCSGVLVSEDPYKDAVSDVATVGKEKLGVAATIRQRAVAGGPRLRGFCLYGAPFRPSARARGVIEDQTQ